MSSRATRFAARDTGPAARMAGFLGHLRAEGLRLGVGETELALRALEQVEAARPEEARRALKAICTGCREEAQRFDDLFDSFWLNEGRVRARIAPRTSPAADNIHSSRHGQGEEMGGAGAPSAADGSSEGEAERDGEGRLIATKVRNLSRRDLRDLVRPEEVAEAEQVARALGAVIRDRRSRRRKAALKGDRIDFRRVMRRAVATGGEPLSLPKRRRPDRSVKIAALCDVSGSMSVYAQVFLAFLAGLMRADPRTDAYIFHTRLTRIAEALREKDPMRALARLSLMAEGFGGGSQIGASLQRYADTYARRFVDGRTIVLILSDGYDSGPPGHLSAALARLRRRGCRIIWLNPLKSWADYAPVAGGMSAALPHLSLFAPAATLADLAALEPELARL